MHTGKLITFEGGEGSGKSTHIALLEAALIERGYPVLVVREPGGTELGEAIRAILLSRAHDQMSPLAELLLYEAARTQIVSQVIAPALAAGTVVLCDRFIDSTVAYQGFGRGLDRAMIDHLNTVASAGIKPDVTLIFDVPVEDGLRRAARKGAPDRLESQDRTFHEAVRAGFADLAAAEPDRIHLLDATRDKDVVAAEVTSLVEAVLDRVR